ncbi:MAG: ABC transporter permease [Firmicutes bacterium]|nr:ABC transporter permease [Bacillota bacterium]
MNGRARRRTWGERAALAWTVLMYAFFFVPLATVALMSFNRSSFGTFPIVWSLHWYHALLHGSGLLPAVGLSLEIGVVVAVASVVLGAMAAYAMARHPGAWTRPFTVAFAATITVPWIILSIGMNIVLATLTGQGNSVLGLYVGDLALSLPYAVLVLLARLSQLDAELEQAARSLGASALTAFWRVTLPLAAPGFLAVALMAFIVCFNNFIVQYFLAPFGVQTLPLVVYNSIRVGYSPDIDALSTLLVAGAVVMVLVVQRLGAVRDVVGRRSG